MIEVLIIYEQLPSTLIGCRVVHETKLLRLIKQAPDGMG